MSQELIALVFACVVGFVSVYFSTPFLIKFLQKRNLSVKDYNKKELTMVVRPGGPVIILGIVASEIILYIFLQNLSVLAIISTTVISFIVGLIDDKKVMGGWFKPIGLAIATIPLIILGTYDSSLLFPIFGHVTIPLLYIGVIVVIIPITGNTINSIDVLNGVASGFMTIAGFTLSIALFIIQNYDIAIASLPLGFVSLAFYKYHKIPSKIFPGDSGALSLGGMYGAIAIVGGVEIVAAVALLPAVINSFLFLSSMKRIVEHREIKAKPVEHTDDFRLKATNEKNAPVTLVRLILAAGPLSEKQVGYAIFKLAIFSSALAIITAILMRVTV